MKTFYMESTRTPQMGPVAYGVEFDNGTVVVNWCRDDLPSSTVIWNSIEDAREVHEGLGSWRIVFDEG